MNAKTKRLIGTLKEGIGEAVGSKTLALDGQTDKAAATYEEAKAKKPSNLVPSEDNNASNKGD
ncbi:MAG: hypothetical protein P4M15_12660 [Alphaproteobacteria bacterium]|nr:hypothetical protein [Alphaproteobacteria bacterium]